MQAARRKDYLQALGMDLWVLRAAVATRCFRGLVIGPGNTSTLVLCADASEAASALAADIARSLDCEPVWSWLAEEESGQGIALEQAIAESLYTRVLVLGDGLLNSVLDRPAEIDRTRIIGSASILVAASVPELAQHGKARYGLWQQLTASNWCGARTAEKDK